ncbi:MAG: hypothetical protein ACO3QM_06620 [Candidatus Nanopelagicaceae bacterium]
MDTKERKYRFTEIVTAITLLPDLSELDEAPTLPDKTIGLADHALKSALVSQAFREGEVFSNKLSNALVASAMTNIHENEEPTADDMSAIGLAMSIVWAHNEIPYFLHLAGLVGQIFEKFHNDDNCDFLIPSEIMAILSGNKKAKDFAQFEPYDLLEDKVDVLDVMKAKGIPSDLMEQLAEAINRELGNTEGGE